MLALTDMTTARALQRSGKSTAIEKENYLLAGLQFFFHVSLETFRKNCRSTFLFPGLVAHVYNPNERESLAVCSLGESNEIVFS